MTDLTTRKEAALSAIAAADTPDAVEAQRIEQRTRFDLEMLHELGFCKGG